MQLGHSACVLETLAPQFLQGTMVEGIVKIELNMKRV